MLDRPPFTRYYWNGTEFAAGNSSDSTYPVAFSPFESTSYYGTSKGGIHGRELSMIPDGYNLNGFASFIANGEQWNTLPMAATVPITGSIAGTVLTVAAVGIATNPNGTTLAGAVKRGHFITGDVGIPAGTYIMFDPADTGAGSTGTYKLSADCGTIALKAFSLTCADGVGGCLARVTDPYSGPNTSADTDAQKVWMLTIDPTHRVTLGHGRAILQSGALQLRRRYRAVQQFHMYDQVNAAWQQSNSTTVEPNMAIISLEQLNASGNDYDANQSVLNGPFAVYYSPGGSLNFAVRTPNENFAKKQVDGFWNWTEGDRNHYFNSRVVRRQMKGTDPVSVTLEFFLDERFISEGGKGWLKAWFNDELVVDYVGPTSHPRGRNTGNAATITYRIGMYDVTYGIVADNTLCSAARSTAIQRNLAIRYANIQVKE